MENNGWKFGFFFLIIIGIAVGGFVLMQRSFPEKKVIKPTSKVVKKKKDIRIDKNKDYIYFENAETIAHDLDIEYKDVILNFNDPDNIQGKLNDETKNYKDSIEFSEDMEEADFDGVLNATYKTYEYYIYEDYISLVVNYYTFDRENLISYKDTDTYIFDRLTGKRFSEEEILANYKLTKDEVLEKVEDFVDGKNLLTDDELDASLTVESIDDMALFIDRVGRLSMAILVKSEQKDYNEIVLLS